MIVGIDGRAFLGNKTGVGKYMVELCKTIDMELTNCEFYIFCNKDFEFPELRNNKWTKVIENNLLTKFKTTIWFKFFSFITLKRFNLDLYIGATSMLPYFLEKRLKTILVIYDMNHLLVPETMSWHNKLIHKLFYKEGLNRADKIISISNGTANKLKQYYDKDSNLIFYPKVMDTFKVYPEEETKKVINKFNLEYKNYLLSVSTMEPRKNIALLIESFVELIKENKIKDKKLVLAGRKGWKEGRIFNLVEKYKDNIVFLGYVLDENLPYIYNGAKVFVFPSKYEGFGMPVREAVLCGTQVIASDICEIKEAGGEFPTYIEPKIENIKEAILKELEKETIINKNIMFDEYNTLGTIFDE